MQDKYYRQILTHIQRYVPEFRTIFDEEDVYPITDEFGRFLIENIMNDELMQRASLFIDEAISVGENMTEDLIVIQVFQLVYEDKNIIAKFRKHLSDDSTLLFDKCQKEYKKLYK